MDPEAEYEEYDVAEDGAGNFLVYRRGGWYPSTRDGRLLQSIPADDWEPGAVELPNGNIMGPRGSRGGRREKIGTQERPNAFSELGEAPSVTAETRGRLAFGLPTATAGRRRMAEMEQGGVNPLNRDWGAAAIQMIPDWGAFDTIARVIGGQDFQSYDQAAASIEAAVLPIFSGLAVTDSEARRFVRANSPRLGDTAETLAAKGRNVERILNTGSWMMGQPIPFPNVPMFDPAGEGMGGTPLAETGAGASSAAAQPPQGGAPGSSQDNPFDFTTASREDVINAIKRGGWFRQGPEGEPYQLPPSDPEFGAMAGDEAVAPGVVVRPRMTPDEAIEARREDQGIGRRIDALVRGAADAATFGLSDEITAGLNTIAPLERGSVGGWSGDWGGAYEQNLALARGLDEADAEQMPLTRGTGQVVGAVGSGVGAARLAPQALRVVPRAAGATRAANTARIAQNAGRMAVGGALGGGAYGLGSAEGTLPERIPNALEGAGIGAVAAPAASALASPVIRAVTPAAAAVGRTVARPVAALGEALNVPGAADFASSIRPNALSGAADIYARRFKPDTNALSARVAEQEALGMEPAFIDVIDDARSGTFRALNTRDTAAREAAARLPETRRRNLPARVRQIAEEEISPESRPMTEVMDELAATRRANAREGGMDFTNENVRLDENIVSALRSPVARSSLMMAANVAEASLDPAERQAAAALRRLASSEGDAGAQLTVREVQDISKALNTAARSAFNSENPTAGPALSGLAKAIRDQGRNQSEGYRNWLTQYADDMQLEEAATTGRNFVTADPNPINERSTNAFVRQAEQATPPELAVQRAAARGAMEAQGSGPTGARGILENLASNVDQQRRAAALGINAERLAARSDAELRAVQAAQRISPRVGSETATNLADQAGEIAGTARDVMTGNIPNIVGRIGRRIMSRGFNDREAEAISLAAMDPTRTREVIDMLATRMNRTEARNMLRAIRFAATRGAGESAGDEE